MRYFGKNIRPFSAVCNNNYGREVIYTKAERITPANICDELSKSLPAHYQNQREIEYLEKYYKGDQPILYRKKANRPEINNRIVQNLAYMLVETKTAEMVGEPIQYVQRGTDERKTNEIIALNEIMLAEHKKNIDISLCRWRSICGTAYLFVDNDRDIDRPLLDQSNFSITVEKPFYTYIVYYQNDRSAYSVQIREDEKGKTFYFVYTNAYWFKISNGKIIESGINGNGAIPVIEYPNNERRLSDIEITISITDEINRMCSDRANGIEQFICSWVKFVNCEIDAETYSKMRQEGALVVKSNNGSENKADVEVMTTELNQQQSQIAVDDLFDKFLLVQGMASRQGNTGGDTQGAVMLRNGWRDSAKRAELAEPILQKSEIDFLRIILNRLRIERGFSLLPSDIEVKINRTNMDNLYTKTESLKLMLDSGIYPARAIKTVGIWNDPEQVSVESKDRMDILYPTEIVNDGIEQDRPVEQS